VPGPMWNGLAGGLGKRIRRPAQTFAVNWTRVSGPGPGLRIRRDISNPCPRAAGIDDCAPDKIEDDHEGQPDHE